MGSSNFVKQQSFVRRLRSSRVSFTDNRSQLHEIDVIITKIGVKILWVSGVEENPSTE